MPNNKQVTQLLLRSGEGDEQALAAVFNAVYDDLKQIAASYMRREKPGHTLQPTALVNEAYFRLVDQTAVNWQNRSHFFGIAAQVMRRILVDHARAQKAAKRGGGLEHVTFIEALGANSDDQPDVEALDEALIRLATLNERQCKVVELRFFAGLSIDEAADVLGTSPSTVKRDWDFARTWLHRELNQA